VTTGKPIINSCISEMRQTNGARPQHGEAKPLLSKKIFFCLKRRKFSFKEKRHFYLSMFIYVYPKNMAYSQKIAQIISAIQPCIHCHRILLKTRHEATMLIFFLPQSLPCGKLYLLYKALLHTLL
jgi:hypothetical protein